ncbi:auxin efflux carrier component 5-like isoform X2 [Lycium barbarum]|nr:auxin efflux carrier component 5-like isoform X2 [Lycium barbarum]
MIGWEVVYKVVVAMAPLYVALILGYASVKWWRIFTQNQCDAINHLVCYFTLPLFTFEFTAHIDPFEMNYKFLGADAISKVIIVVVLASWAKCSTGGSYRWSITSFSLSTLTNSLVVGVPLMKAMYGEEAVHLVVQGSVTQAIVWLTILLFVLEMRTTRTDFSLDSPIGDKNNIVLEENNGSDLEGNNAKAVASITRPSFWCLTRKVWLKLATNPNSYACMFGLTWALVSNRWHIQMPSIIEGSILVMSRAGTGTAMFSMGMFMALQEKVIACGATLTMFGMALRFIAGPAAMAIASIAIGLHGDVLRVP